MVGEFSAWAVENSGRIPLTYDSSSRTWRGVVEGGTPFKLMQRDANADQWVWMPGPNLTAEPGTSLPIAWHRPARGTAVLQSDPYLADHASHLANRYARYESSMTRIAKDNAGLDAFSRGYEYYGFTRGAVGGAPGIFFREWAPGARSASLIGDFNAWSISATPLSRDDFGVWSTFLPDLATGEEAITHDTFVRLSLVLPDGSRANRIPAYARYAVRDPVLNEYVAKYWSPPPSARHSWAHERLRTHVAADYTAAPSGSDSPIIASRAAWLGRVGPAEAAIHGFAAPPSGGPSPSTSHSLQGSAAGAEVTSTDASGAKPAGFVERVRAAFDADGRGTRRASPQGDPAKAGLRIYESHVGMAGEEPKVSTYREFASVVLPRVKALGYNCVQLMAIMEHAYYGSFGYHVTSFLAPSSRFGTPEDLKFLVDAAHGLGLLVIMDCVHSHASKNVVDGLNEHDGTDFQFFHAGAKGAHELWDSRLFDYAKIEVQRFLLSSLRLFVEEFRFDGFRFDGVTSMMYLHHGLGVGFSGSYDDYFSESTDLDAVNYLQLANTLLHTLDPPAISIAEDVSGMPTLGRPVWEGGVGFDYRLSMAIPDIWIKLLKETSDENWDIANIAWTLTNRRHQEKCIAYSESHDQALVGDKTIAFWLMDKEMYFHMTRAEAPRHPVIDRGLSLHKLIRLVTCALGGEGWLNFMGNEFGHPEWVDFPRAGNDWSYHYCRRQWSLADRKDLLYGALAAFDAGMHALGDRFTWLEPRTEFVSTKDNNDKVLVFDLLTRNGPLVFIFNFNATQSFTGYRVGVPAAGEWGVALDSDWADFAGYERVDRKARFVTEDWKHHGRDWSVQVYSPARTVLVLERVA